MESNKKKFYELMQENDKERREYRDVKEPERMEKAKEELRKLGIEIAGEDKVKLTFIWKGKKVTLFPYTGWHSGKSIKDGRGLFHLLKQLKDGKD